MGGGFRGLQGLASEQEEAGGAASLRKQGLQGESSVGVPSLVAGRCRGAVGDVVTKGVRGHCHGTPAGGAGLPWPRAHRGKRVSTARHGPRLL